MRRMDDRGFSLIELIIVVAIMAVLMGILAPQFIKYIEHSRERKDEHLLSVVEDAARAAYALGEVYDSLPAGDSVTTVTICEGDKISSNLPKLEEELHRTLPESIHFASRKYIEGGEQTVSISIDVVRKEVIVTHSWD